MLDVFVDFESPYTLAGAMLGDALYLSYPHPVHIQEVYCLRSHLLNLYGGRFVDICS